MFDKTFKFLLVAFIVSGTSGAIWAEESRWSARLFYEEDIYSSEGSTTWGSRADLDASLTYHFSELSFATLRIDTAPESNPQLNETSHIDLMARHRHGDLEVGVDSEWSLSDGDGGQSLGFDDDSELNFIGMYFANYWRASLHPFHLGSEVGKVFSTGDVAKVHAIVGEPTALAPVQDLEVETRTIPGVRLTYQRSTHYQAYLGIGVLGFAYPRTEPFDLGESVATDGWKTSEAQALVFGFRGQWSQLQVGLEHAQQNQTQESGALLQQATALQVSYEADQFRFGLEAVHSVAGERPWDVQAASGGFSETQLSPYYVDADGLPQDWQGEGGTALDLRFAQRLGEWQPYLRLGHLSEFFIFEEKESAHILRTADMSKSHGGIQYGALGVEWRQDDYQVGMEWLSERAENEVFLRKSDRRGDRLLSDMKTSRETLTLSLTMVSP